jgi:hypothetical protein
VSAQPLFTLRYTPDLAEHLYARREMARWARIFDLRGAIPWLFALSMLSNLIIATAWGDVIQVWIASGSSVFFLGMGLGVRLDQRRPVTVTLDEEGISVAQPRRRWSFAWERVQRVEEGERLWIFVGPGHAFYLPRRALADPGETARLRQFLQQRVAVQAAPTERQDG